MRTETDNPISDPTELLPWEKAALIPLVIAVMQVNSPIIGGKPCFSCVLACYTTLQVYVSCQHNIAGEAAVPSHRILASPLSRECGLLKRSRNPPHQKPARWIRINSPNQPTVKN